MNNSHNASLPHLTAILAISVDGKISMDKDMPARFSTSADLAHLEKQISLCDAIIFGANTLRAYGTSLVIKNTELLQQRKQCSKPPQPLNIVCSASGNLNSNWLFFSQPLSRALLTTEQGKINWFEQINDNINFPLKDTLFEKYFISTERVNWQVFLRELNKLNYKKIAILGGEKLISSLLKESLIHDIWLTICPLIIGKSSAPSFLSSSLLDSFNTPINLKLLEIKQIEQEVFCHYMIKEK